MTAHRCWPFVLTLAFLACALLLLSDELPAQPSAEEPSAKADVLETADFLKAPAGVQGDFVMAKTPPRVEVCFFAGLKEGAKGTLWSSWGDGCLATNGKYYTSVGDHLGIDANSCVYEYDPMTRVLRRVVDVLRAIGHMLGLFGHGKIHSGLHQAADGKIYFTTYWGKQREIDAAFTKGYNGSVMLRYDPATGKTENLGAIVPKQGLPASHFDAERQLIYYFAVYKGDVTVYDVKAQKVKFLGGGDSSVGHRTFLGAADGKTYFSGKDEMLHYYDPTDNQLHATTIALPTGQKTKKGDSLRAAARPMKSGLLHGMTAAGRLFSLEPATAKVKDLGPNFLGGDYTAVMVLSPDEKYLYYAPGAHGSGVKTGVPVVQYNIATGQRKVLAFLQEPLRSKHAYTIGGTYNVQIDGAGEKLYFTFNGAPATARGAFGRPSVVVVNIPASERS